MREVKLPRQNGMHKARVADVSLRNGYTVEFQHSRHDLNPRVAQMESATRTADHIRAGKRVVWLLDAINNERTYGDYRVIVSKSVSRRDYVLFFRPCASWLYEDYTCTDHIYVQCHCEKYREHACDAECGRVFRVAPTEVTKTGHVRCATYKSRSEVLSSLHQGRVDDGWVASDAVDTRVYAYQRGAGNGKTFEATRLFCDPRHADKDTILFLSKTHATKNVSAQDFETQVENDQLALEHLGDGLYRQRPFVTPADVGKAVCIRNEELFVDNVSRAAYWSTTVCDLAGTITAVDGCMKIDGREVELPVSNHRTVRVQFATLDSLFYILGCEDGVVYRNALEESRVAISARKVDVGRWVKFHGLDMRIGKGTLICVDEAQDLTGPWYHDALYTLACETNADVAVFGDKLQSVYGDRNVFAALSSTNCSDPVNECRRFGPRIASFVNAVVPFSAFSLPQVSSRFAPDCERPVNWFEETGSAYEDAETILRIVASEVETSPELKPSDILVISPFVKNNSVFEMLEMKIDDFWRRRLGATGEWYAQFHRSTPGRAIDTSTSKQATRLMSIHGCKGMARCLVIVYGCNHRALSAHSRGCELQYESLFHVALTRASSRLFIGVGRASCAIRSRLERWFTLPTAEEAVSDVYRNVASLPTMDSLPLISTDFAVVSNQGFRANMLSQVIISFVNTKLNTKELYHTFVKNDCKIQSRVSLLDLEEYDKALHARDHPDEDGRPYRTEYGGATRLFTSVSKIANLMKETQLMVNERVAPRGDHALCLQHCVSLLTGFGRAGDFRMSQNALLRSTGCLEEDTVQQQMAAFLRAVPGHGSVYMFKRVFMERGGVRVSAACHFVVVTKTDVFMLFLLPDTTQMNVEETLSKVVYTMFVYSDPSESDPKFEELRGKNIKACLLLPTPSPTPVWISDVDFTEAQRNFDKLV